MASPAILCAMLLCNAPQSVRGTEAAYAAVRLADGIQSQWIGRTPGVIEKSDIFSSGWIIGSKPSAAASWHATIADIAVHAATTSLLVRTGHTRAARVFQAITLAYDVGTVAENARLGLAFRL